jgi:hypothetical protein
MKTLTVRLPEALVAQIEAESRRRKLSKSDVRERLTAAGRSREGQPAALDEGAKDNHRRPPSNGSNDKRSCLLWVAGCCGSYVGITTGVPQTAGDLPQRTSRQSRATSSHSGPSA